jgi:hypothetical protein
VVVTESLQLEQQLETAFPVRLVASRPGISLSHSGGPVLMATCALVEGLTLCSGSEEAQGYYCADCDSFHESEEQSFFPALELFKHSGMSTKGGWMILRCCKIMGKQGSAVMCDSGNISLDACEVASSSFFGLICKSTEAFSPPFSASLRSCIFRESLWHISAGPDVSEEDIKALMAGSRMENPGEAVTKHNSEWTGGVLQPWRSEFTATSNAAERALDFQSSPPPSPPSLCPSAGGCLQPVDAPP